MSQHYLRDNVFVTDIFLFILVFRSIDRSAKLPILQQRSSQYLVLFIVHCAVD